MKRFLSLLTVAAALVLGAGPALADARGAEVEAAMREYLRLWNAHDAGAIVDHIYRLDGSNPMARPGALQAEFDRLKADGYDHSDIASVKGCLISKDVGVVELRFSRVRADGSALPPKDRTSLYLWRRFPDGWRVIQFFGMGAGASFACTSVTAP
jgi:hypothetical protein